MADQSPIEKAIAIFGSEDKLGKACGFSQVAINKAKRAGRASADMAVAISRVSKIPLSEFLPEIADAMRAEMEPAPEKSEAAA